MSQNGVRNMYQTGTLNLTLVLTGIPAALPVGGRPRFMAEALSLSPARVFRYPSPTLPSRSASVRVGDGMRNTKGWLGLDLGSELNLALDSRLGLSFMGERATIVPHSRQRGRIGPGGVGRGARPRLGLSDSTPLVLT